MENKPIYNIDIHGTKRWYLDDKLHNEYGPAVVYASGSKEWYIRGKRHRLYGPAVEYNDGHQEWWIDGKSHKLDGPAVRYKDGSTEWWVNDCPVSNIITIWANMNDIDLDNLSEDDKSMIKLIWADYQIDGL